MTQFLASVRDADEAEIALGAGADIIDLKEPGRGALGAVDDETVKLCVRAVAGRVCVSATVGDGPAHEALRRDTIARHAASGVDLVKIGIFPERKAEQSLLALADAGRGARLVLVLFADALPSFDAAAVAVKLNAKGIMLDTMAKRSGSLLDHLGLDLLTGFVANAKAHGLMVGLAGSLRPEHVEPLLALHPDLLGFRGALCRDGARGASLDAAACAVIRSLIPRSEPRFPRAQFDDFSASALC